MVFCTCGQFRVTNHGCALKISFCLFETHFTEVSDTQILKPSHKSSLKDSLLVNWLITMLHRVLWIFFVGAWWKKTFCEVLSNWVSLRTCGAMLVHFNGNHKRLRRLLVRVTFLIQKLLDKVKQKMFLNGELVLASVVLLSEIAYL